MKNKTSGVLSCLGHSDSCMPAWLEQLKRETFLRCHRVQLSEYRSHQTFQDSSGWEEKQSWQILAVRIPAHHCLSVHQEDYIIHIPCYFLAIFCNHKSLMEKCATRFPHGAWDCLEQAAEAPRDEVKFPYSILIRQQWTRATSKKLSLFILTRHYSKGKAFTVTDNASNEGLRKKEKKDKFQRAVLSEVPSFPFLTACSLSDLQREGRNQPKSVL